MRYLVTGGAGFIGSHLVEALLSSGGTVRVIDNFSSGSRINLAAVEDHPALEIVEGDLRCRDAVEEAVSGTDVIFHQAGLVSVVAAVEKPDESFSNNAQGTFHVFDAARRHEVNRVVYASSAAIYGENTNTPLVELEQPVPLSPYALDKLYSEQLATLFFHLYGLHSVGLRYFNVFGPRQDPSSPYSGVISIFIDRVRQGKPAVVYGDGEQTRDFIFVEDVVAANLAAAALHDGHGGVCYNIASGTSVSINELATQVGEVAGTPLQREWRAARAGDIRHSLACIDRAREELEWSPETKFLEGLAKTFAAAP